MSDFRESAGIERRRAPRVGWRAGRLGLVQGRLWTIIVKEPTLATRLSLSIVAALWVLALLMPGDSFTRPTFAVMRSISGAESEVKWSVAFALYGLVNLTCAIFDCPKSCSYAINLIGVIIYSAITLSVAMVGGAVFPAGSAAHAGIALAALWVFVRTDINSPPGWQHG